MRCVLQAALDLSTSTKPFDSVTAAHLLNLLLHQPDLGQALDHCAQQQGLSFQAPSPLPQASETLLLEVNTLAGKSDTDLYIFRSVLNTLLDMRHTYFIVFVSTVVQYLLCCLQSEVLRAEMSLLQAAASHPLYGRAHCITAVLQHLNTE